MSAEFELDLSVLRLLKTRKNYERFAQVVPAGTINKETAALVKRFGQYFKAVEADKITYAEFWPWMRTQYPNWKDKDTAFWSATIKPIDRDNPLGLDEQIITNLLATELGLKVVSHIENWRDGGEIELGESIRMELERYDDSVQRKVKHPLVELDWDDMLEEETNDTGLQWRINALRRSTRNLRPGDFGIIAMRPDRGKTTLVASEVTYFAPQLRTLYPDETRPILWLNNEGPGRRIVSRLRQSALGLSISEIIALGPKKAQAKYEELVGGNDMIRVLDIHGFAHYEVEELFRKHRPGVVVFDMIDNIQFRGGTINNGERSDQILEAMYGWARTQGVVHEFVGLATSQISGDGEGERFPKQNQLKDSKTGKQGACDFIITGGQDPNLPNQRFIAMTKNKIKREGADYSPDAAYFFDADRGRLVEPSEDS